MFQLPCYRLSWLTRALLLLVGGVALMAQPGISLGSVRPVLPSPQPLVLSATFTLPAPFPAWRLTRELLDRACSRVAAHPFVSHLRSFSWCNNATPTYRIVSVQTTSPGGDSWCWPVRGGISSGFGMRRHPVTRRRGFHSGIDIKAPRGTPVRAPCDGIVVSARPAGALGRLVKLRTSQGQTLYFGHLSAFKCRLGQSARRGQILGLVGSSGRTTGPHLHFSVAVRGRYLNPVTFLSRF